MIISSWNVNSIRARILNVQEYLKKFNPDIVLTQEIKTQEETYPFDDIKKLKYESYVFGQKSYNGVAILSKKKLDKIEKDIFKDKNKQSRIITADAKYKSKTIKIINIYTPNGNPVDTEKYDYKLYWLNSLIKKLKTLLKSYDNIIIAGDFNIIPSAEDVHDPKGYENDALFRIEIRKKLREMFNLGFHDAFRYIYPDKEEYTFWDYTSGAWQKNNGMRIDHFLVTNSLLNNIKDVKVNKYPRGREKPSDHTPIELELT
ncbi:exodeoxyribonuclease III [Candidatus Pelagibacter sp.]|nr:exodeoxyribonuclease III [Candidatus Pelagibacter sp.]